MKRTGLFLVFAVLLAVGTAAAHDKGDLLIGAELKFGAALNGGIDFAIGHTAHCYFTDFFGISTGWGISTWFIFSEQQSFTGIYFTVPVGFRFSSSAFVFGGGITANIPIDEYEFSPPKVSGIFNMGWYIDIGFDLSGRENRRNGFGLQYRLHGSFSDFSRPSKSNSNYKASPYIAISAVFQINFQIAGISFRGS